MFSAVERIEEPVGGLRVETGSRVLHGQANAITFVLFGFDQQLPGRSSTVLIASDAFASRFKMTC